LAVVAAGCTTTGQALESPATTSPAESGSAGGSSDIEIIGGTYDGTIVGLNATKVAAGDGSIVIDISLPPGHKVNDDAPSSLEWRISGDILDLPIDGPSSLKGAEFPLSYPATFHDGIGTVAADIELYWCAEDAEELCYIEDVRLLVPVSVGAGESTEVRLAHRFEIPEIPS
jgi:hypothetical protein